MAFVRDRHYFKGSIKMFRVAKDSLTEKLVLYHPHEERRSVWFECPHEWRLLEKPEADDDAALDH